MLIPIPVCDWFYKDGSHCVNKPSHYEPGTVKFYCPEHVEEMKRNADKTLAELIFGDKKGGD